MNQKDMNDEMEIDLLDLAYMLMDHWHHLLLWNSAYIPVNFQTLCGFYFR